MIKEIIICLSLWNMNGVVNQENICNNIHHINSSSKKHNIDSTLLISLFWVESNFYRSIKSYNGTACGIGQVVPKWSSDYKYFKNKFKRKEEKKRVCNRLNHDFEYSINESSRILSIYKRFYKEKRLMLCGYNKGYRCNLDEENKYLFKSGLIYADEVLKFQKRLKRKIKKTRKFLKKLNFYF